MVDVILIVEVFICLSMKNLREGRELDITQFCQILEAREGQYLDERPLRNIA